jgi:transposase
MGDYYVGLDVHSRESVFVIQHADGTIVARGSVPTDSAGLRRLRDAHGLPAGTPVALETGTLAFFAARQLAELELGPVVIDAHEVRAKASRPRQKSDRRDAFELCDGIRRQLYRALVHVPSPTVSHLRETLSRRRHFVRQQTAEVNATKRLLRAVGLGRVSAPSLKTEAAWDSLLARLPADESLRTYIGHHRALWQCAGVQVVELDRRLRTFAVAFRSEVRRLQTVPGVGPIVALTVIAVFADVTRFPDAKHVASYAGLVPSTDQSGDRDRHGHITKRGSRELRAMLCEAAHHARRASHPLNPYFATLCARHGYKRATIAVAHRLCRILFAMLRDGTDFQPQRLGLEEGPFTRTITRRYRLTPRRT